MKFTLAAAAIALATTAAANAAGAATVWQGDMFITTDTKTTSACNSVGIATGDFVQAIFTPKNLPNVPTDQLAVFFLRGSAHQIVPKSPATTLSGATSVKITHINHDAGLKTEIITLGPIQITSPATGIQSVTILVPDLGDGCKATFKGVLTQRPGNLRN